MSKAIVQRQGAGAVAVIDEETKAAAGRNLLATVDELSAVYFNNSEILERRVNVFGFSVDAVVLGAFKPRSVPTRKGTAYTTTSVSLMFGNMRGCNFLAYPDETPEDRIKAEAGNAVLIEVKEQVEQAPAPAAGAAAAAPAQQPGTAVVPFVSGGMGGGGVNSDSIVPAYRPAPRASGHFSVAAAAEGDVSHGARLKLYSGVEGKLATRLDSWVPRLVGLSGEVLDLAFGDVIHLTDVNARLSKGVIYVGAGGYEKRPGHNIIHLYHEFYNSTKQNMHFTKSTTPYTNSKGEARYENDLLIFRMAGMLDETAIADAAVEECSSYGILPSKNLQDKKMWVMGGVNNEPEKMRFQATIMVSQWDGKYSGEKGRDTAVELKVDAYEDALRGFYIRDVGCWNALGPAIMTLAPCILMGQVDLRNTKSMRVNENESLAKELGIAFGIGLSTRGILVDAPNLYRRIGVPVTARWAQTYYETLLKQKRDITALSRLNLHSQPDSPVINIREWNGSINGQSATSGPTMIWNNPDVIFRVVTNLMPPTNAMMPDPFKKIAMLSDAEGDLLMNMCTSRSQVITGASRQVVEKLTSVGMPPNLYFTVFAIFKSRLYKRENGLSPSVRHLFNGQPTEEDEDEVHGATVDAAADAHRVTTVKDPPQQQLQSLIPDDDIDEEPQQPGQLMADDDGADDYEESGASEERQLPPQKTSKRKNIAASHKSSSGKNKKKKITDDESE